jgi:thiol reductant ABC exporter CydD subunit
MAAVDRRLLRASRAARRQLAVAAVLAVATAALVVAQAALLADAIARAFLHGASLADLRGPLIALAVVLAARALTAGAFELSGRRGAAAAMSELRARLARQLLVRRPLRPAERVGELAATAVQGVDALEAYLAGYVPQLLLGATVPLAVLAWIAPRDPVAAALLAVTIPLLILFMALVGRSARDAARRRHRVLSLLGAHFLDVVRGLETLRAHNREAAQADTIAAVGDRYRAETMATLRVAFLSALVLELVAMLGTALVAAAIGLQLVAGALTLQVGLAALLLAPELYAPLRDVGRQFHASADGLAAAQRIFAVLEQPASVRAPAAPVAAPDPGVHGLRFERVSFAHGERAGTALDGVELELAPGAVTALVGPSGAGKSTLAALALRLADPDGGRVSCGGVELRDVDPDDWRARVAWVPQRPRLLAGTVAEYLRPAGAAPPAARVRAALEAAGAARFVGALPAGLDTRIGDGGRALSAGEAQRLALARAFLRDAPLLVLDEPTAQLDAATAAGVADAIARRAPGRTVLLITHDPALAARADRVVELRRGRLVAPAAALEVAA